MKQVIASLLAFGLIAGPIAATPAEAQRRSDQGEARKEMRAGNILRAREIENRILPQMKGAEYLGFDYDSTAMAYRLKFIREGRVIYVDVDARTGRVLRRSN
ncbi:PepSY domain-containing protein [Qipengyuania flava]|uniref:PepSY domain-containing protein n=1 Tax=Qipengyuania aestuarii TaxID=2867241 RepID=UPI001C87B0B7|nr:PepSY domain-containing protein [Qipengyuania aestuarii]MBX7534656.1 PepSY domain-containing protein [Qipengyuania aestuarii]MCA0977138.1 PepSY domain-containing protein [Qipengyuania flava]